MQNDLEEITLIAAQKFKEIRDIPYILGSNDNPNIIGTCYKKHMKLLEELVNLGYTVQIRISQFDWKDLPFPENLKNVLGEDTREPHMSLYFKLGEYEGVVDLTFDNALRKAGFTVYDWDGKSSTGAAVEEYGEARMYNPKILWLRGKISALVDVGKNLLHFLKREEIEQERWGRNVKLINDYFNSVRSSYSV
jgi:hypothetical protein